MRIIAISGSPRGHLSNTRRLAERVLEGAEAAGADVELADLGEMNLVYCTACQVCHVSGKCVKEDDFEPLRVKMLEADGIVLASPVYFNSVTAQLKTILDRLADVMHCQLFLGKYGCSVATAGSPESDLGITYMNELLTRFGCNVVGGVGASPAIPGSLEAAEKAAVELGRDLVQAIREGRTYPEQEKIHEQMHERFRRLISFNKENWPYEYDYWASRNWL